MLRGFRRRIILLITTLIIFCFIGTQAQTESQKISGIYSNVTYFKEAGDLYGYEVELKQSGLVLTGTLTYYIGTGPQRTQAIKSGRVKGNQIVFYSTAQGTRVKFVGQLENTGIKGKLWVVMKSGKLNDDPEELNLKKIKTSEKGKPVSIEDGDS
jgi:hypothetical protein